MFPKETRVLVVDDALTIRKIVRRQLEELGFVHVFDAPDGESAWEKIQFTANTETPFGLIISDWMMPHMKGIDLLRHVRSIAKMKTTPFIILTAEADKDKVLEALKEGVSTYMVKPFTTEDLVNKLNQLHAASLKKAG